MCVESAFWSGVIQKRNSFWYLQSLTSINSYSEDFGLDFFFPWDIKILGCCPVVTSLLPHEEKVPWLALWLVGCLVKSFDHPSAWGRCFTTSTDLTPYLFQMGWLKLNLILLLNQWDWLREMNAGGSCNHWRCSSFFGFLRPNLSPRGYRNGCFLVTLSSLIVRRP